jgi:hypothetical protein
MSRLYLLVVDFLIIAAGMAWAYVAGRHSIIIARGGWPPGAIGNAIVAIPFAGMALQLLFVWLAAAERLFTATWLAVFSLTSALALLLVETFGHFVGYR